MVIAAESATPTDYQVIIAGAGDLGQRIALGLHRADISVLAIRRSTMDRPYDTLACNLLNGELSDKKLSCDILIYSVAADAPDPETYRKAYYHGLKETLAAVAHKRVLFISSTRVYGSETTGWIDESTDYSPADQQGAILAEASSLLGNSDCSLHLAGIYGPGRDRMLRMASEGSWAKPGHITNRIHVDDAANLSVWLCQQAIQQQMLWPPRILGTDGQGADLHSVLEWLREQMNIAPNPDKLVSRSGPGKACRSVWLKESGFNFQYPDFQSGYSQLLKLRSHNE